MAVQQESKLGAGAPRHAAAPLNMAREALRPPVASLQSRGLSRRPAPHDERAFLPSRHQTNPARIGCAATACPVASTVRLSRPTPRPGVPSPAPRKGCSPLTQTNRAPVGCAATAVPLHRHSGAFAPRHPRAGEFRPHAPRRKGVPALSTPDQPCAGWMRGIGLSRCIDNQGLSRPRHPAARCTVIHDR